MSGAKLRDRPQSKFGAMSGLRASTPESRTPTLTAFLPGWTSRARSDRTIRRPHSWPSSGSIPTAAAVAFAFPLELFSCSTTWRGTWPPGILPIDRLRAAPATAGDADTSVTNPVAGARTVRVPMSAFCLSTVPPAFSTAALAAASEAPSLVRTRYSVVLAPAAFVDWPAPAGGGEKYPPASAAMAATASRGLRMSRMIGSSPVKSATRATLVQNADLAQIQTPQLFCDHTSLTHRDDQQAAGTAIGPVRRTGPLRRGRGDLGQIAVGEVQRYAAGDVAPDLLGDRVRLLVAQRCGPDQVVLGLGDFLLGEPVAGTEHDPH